MKKTAKNKTTAKKKTKPKNKVKSKAKSKNKTKAKANKIKVMCEFCGSEIPAARLAILPDTNTCVQCSQTQPYSEAEIMGLNGTDEQDKNRLNVEDFEEPDTDVSLPFNESW